MSNKTEWKAKQVSLGSTVVTAAVTLALGLFLGFKLNAFLPYLGGAVSSGSDISWSSLNEVYDKLAKNYDGELDRSLVLENAKKGIAASVGDPYTVYLSKDEAAEFTKSLHGDVGSGIGVEMGLRDGYVRILRTLPDNPARKAGVLAGDIIYKVDDEPVYSWDSEDIANVLRGASGTSVKLTVLRDEEELSFDLIRETINNVSAYYELRDDAAIITITRFDTDTGSLVASFANDILNSGAKKIILDLRNNGGGYVSAARDLLSLWLDGEKILIQKSKLSSSDELTYSLRGQALFGNTRTIVLVNENTASASEIVTGALKDYGKATVLGKTTFGKGVVQTMLNLSGSTILKVTTAHWYTPLENSINGTGIEPDIEVEMSYDDINALRDPQLDAALAL
ncbi:S41 family peptidase [Candidatus Saccharibacteria bacterium]|nr:S41 family peptidase [Candidatus Saccharibacteria bacterium]